MLKKAGFVLWILCLAAWLNTAQTAQTVRSKTEYTNDSILAKAQMLNGATGLRDKDLPKEIDALVDDTFRLFYSKFARRGRTEMIYWEYGNFSEVDAVFTTINVKSALGEAGWYLHEDTNPQYSMINLVNVRGDLLNGFVIPTAKGCTLVITEITGFPALKLLKTKILRPNRKTNGNGIGSGNDN